MDTEKARREAAQTVREASYLLKDAARALLEDGGCDADLINDLECERTTVLTIIEELERRLEKEE